MSKVLEILKKPAVFISIGVVVLLMALIVWGAKAKAENDRAAAEAEAEASALASSVAAPTTQGTATGTDQLLLGMQETLNKQHGTPPEGFIWDRNGNPISLGYPDMSSEDVAFGYLRALSTLDTGMAERLSRNSSVIQAYAEYFDTTKSSVQTADDIFKREAFKTAMLSLEVEGIDNSAVFAETKRVYTVSGRIVDFNNITFWEEDKDELFKTLYTMDVEQRDYTRAEAYVNNYVAEYYMSEDAPKRNITFSLTVEKYPDINSGYLVSIDKDLKDVLTNSSGISARTKTVNEYIMEQYRDYKIDRVNSESK